MERIPDDILGHIMSFLDSEDSTRCSFVSQRFQTVAGRKDTMVFDETLFRISHRNKKQFGAFVDRFISIHKEGKIKSFAISVELKTCNHVSRLVQWIRFAIANHVQILEILVHKSKLHNPPPSLFMCNTIEVLTLAKVSLKTSMIVNLPKLKVLNLFKVDISCPNLLSCTNLEELHLCKCDFQDIILRIEAPFLKKISLLNLDTAKEIHLSSAALSVFSYMGKARNFACLSEITSLVEAHIVFTYRPEHDVEEHHLGTKMLACLRKVSKLTLGGFFTQLLGSEPDLGLYLPSCFESLHTLSLEVFSTKEEADAIILLLQHIPHLKKIYISVETQCLGHTFTPDRPLQTRGPDQDIDLKSVEQFDFNGFQGKECELELLEYILENAAHLKKLNFFLPRELHSECMTIHAWILEFTATASPQAEIVVSKDS